jgi:hypothetical protein
MRQSRRLAVLLVVALSPGAAPLGAQDSPASSGAAGARSVLGEVIHDQTAAPLQGASVVLVPDGVGIVPVAGSASPWVMQTRATVTDDAGRYRFDEVGAGSYVLRVHRLGFRPATVDVVLRGGESRISVGLEVVPVRLQPVDVSAELTEPYARRAESRDAEGAARVAALRQRQRRYLATDVREVTHADVVEGVTLGESDLFRALQRLPGVTTRNELSAELWTRGARWDRTRVLFDGLPLFDPLHVAGVFGAVNEDAVGAAFLHLGVRPASIGEGGAGVLDLRSRAGGGTGRVRGVFETTMESTRAALDQRVAGGRGAWMLAGRLGRQVQTTPLTRSTTGQAPFHFSELVGRADWALPGGGGLEASALHEQDALEVSTSGTYVGDRAHWGNDMARVTLETPLAAGALTARHTVGASRYDARVGKAEWALGAWDAADFPLSAGITYLTLGSELAPTARQASAAPWTAGWELVHQRADVSGEARAIYLGDRFDETVTARRAAITNLALWGEHRFQPIPRVTVAPGMRLEIGSALRGTGPLRASPRLSARFVPGDSTVLVSAALGRSYQYTQSLAPVNAIHPVIQGLVPFWLMADGETPPLRTDLFTVGAERWLGERWHGSVNAYARRTDGVLVADPRAGPITGHELFVEGQESAHGAEASLRRIQGRWTTAIGYAYGVATMRAAGEEYAADEDRRQSFDATVMARIAGGWRAGAAFGAGGGAPYTRVVEGQEQFDKATATGYWDPVPATEAPNAERLPNYQALDLLLDWSGSWLWGSRVGLNVQLHNVIARGNVLGYSGGKWCTGSPGGSCTPSDVYRPGRELEPFFGLRIAF